MNRSDNISELRGKKRLKKGDFQTLGNFAAMAASTLISTLCVLIGGLIMTLAVARAKAIPRLLAWKELRKRWRVLVGLMIFFLGGYGLTLYVLIKGNHSYLEILTGVVFLFGASFVFVTVSVGHDSIAMLEAKVVERTSDLMLATSEAEAANRAKTEFMATVSHELRTPLNAIIGFSEILLDQRVGALNDKQIRYSDNVLNSGRHLLELIDRILDVTRIESGEIKLDFSSVCVDRTVTNVCATLEPLAAAKDISLTYSVPKLHSIRADSTRLRQILFNLVANAIKFTPAKGTVKVLVTKLESAVEIQVVDNGVGILTEHQAQVFAPFGQVDAGLNRQNDGVGLGLFITRKLVEMHGGTLTLESEGIVGKGCRFKITIPIERQP